MTEPGFRLVRKGYETTEVDQVVRALRSSVERLEADLSRAHDEGAAASVENSKLTQQVEDLGGRIKMLEETLAEVREQQTEQAQPSFEALGERIGQILILAQSEADELRSSASIEADALLVGVRQQAEEQRAAAVQEVSDLRSRAETEAARILEEARQQADSLLEQAEGTATARLEEAEAVYEAQRAQAAAAAVDFEQTLAERRNEAMDELNAALDTKKQEVAFAEEELNAARAEAQRVTSDARNEAERLVREAQNQVNALLTEAKTRAEGIRQNSERELAAATARRDSITAQLANVRQMLATLGGSQPVATDVRVPKTAQDWADVPAETPAVDAPAPEATH